MANNNDGSNSHLIKKKRLIKNPVRGIGQPRWILQDTLVRRRKQASSAVKPSTSCSASRGSGKSTTGPAAPDLVDDFTEHPNDGEKDAHCSFGPTSSTVQNEDDVVLQYLRLLELKDSLTTIDNSLFILKDMDTSADKLSLKQTKYQVVYFARSNLVSVLCCTCSTQRTQFVVSMLAACSSFSESVLTGEYSDCIHIKVCRLLNVGIEGNDRAATDDHGYCEPVATSTNHSFSFHPLCSPHHILVFKERDFGVVLPRAGKLLCGLCSSHMCQHVKTVQEYVGTGEEWLASLEDVIDNTEDYPASKPIIVTDNPIAISGSRAIAKSNKCPQCSIDMLEKTWSAPVHSFKGSNISQGVFYECHHCSHKVMVDDVALMGPYAISNEVLSHYHSLFVTNAVTLFGFYKNYYLHAFTSMAHGAPTLSYSDLRNTWLSYIDKLDVDIEASFRCDICQSQPSLIICDGITLSYQRRFQEATVVSNTASTLSGIPYKDLIFVGEKRLRTLLLRWTEEDLDCLDTIRGLVEVFRPQLLPAITCSRCPQQYRWFIEQLSKASPAVALVPVDSLSLVTTMLERDLDSEEARDLSCRAPLIFKLYQGQSHREHWVSGCVKVLCQLSQKVADSQPHNIAERLKDIGYFPHLPTQHSRGSYDLDTKPREVVCTKHAASHSTLLPGIFTMHCKHSICIGYSLMVNHESPNMPFSILRTRFSTAPDCVVYDNACALALYSYRRDPGFFRSTKFLIDRFHYRNHTGCNQGFCIDQYPQYTSVNTQVAEQSNALLGRLRSMLSYMNAENFHKHLRQFIWFRNSVSRAKLGMPVQHEELFVSYGKKFSK